MDPSSTWNPSAEYVTPTNQFTAKSFEGTNPTYTGAITVKNSTGEMYLASTFIGTVSFGIDCGTKTSVGSLDIALSKFSASGECLWTKQFGASGGALDVKKLLLDGSGNIIMAGQFSGNTYLGSGTVSSMGGTDMFVAKYSSSGDRIWVNTFGKEYADSINDIAVDVDGNIGVTGSILTNYGNGLSLGGDLLVTNGVAASFAAKFSQGGTHIWSKTFSCASSKSNGTSISSLPGGDFAITGTFESADFGDGCISARTSGGFLYGGDVYVVRVRGSDGNLVWKNNFGGIYNDYSGKIVTDSNGDIFTVGTFSTSITFGADTYTFPASTVSTYMVKISSGTGIPSWSKVITSTTAGTIPAGLSVDSGNNVVVAGSFRGGVTIGSTSLTSTSNSSAAYDMYLFKYSGSGTFAWARKYGGVLSDIFNPPSVSPVSMTTDSNGNIYIGGNFNKSLIVDATTSLTSSKYSAFLMKTQ
jgi:hypothetical protein